MATSALPRASTAELPIEHNQTARGRELQKWPQQHNLLQPLPLLHQQLWAGIYQLQQQLETFMQQREAGSSVRGWTQQHEQHMQQLQLLIAQHFQLLQLKLPHSLSQPQPQPKSQTKPQPQPQPKPQARP